MFDDYVRLEDIKTHAKRFCYQYSNLIINEKEICLSISFLGFLSKTNNLGNNNYVFCNCYI
jgi:hypothetical protein